MFPMGILTSMTNANSHPLPSLLLDEKIKVIFVLAIVMSFSIFAVEHTSN